MDTLRANRRGVGGHTLALGFGATVAMWVIGYASRLPPVWLPSPILVILLLACVFAGGWAAGRHTPAGWRAGAGVGYLSSMVNMVSGQVVLGVAALTVKGMAGAQLPAPLYQVIVTTSHQALGAVLLGVSVLLTAWSRRLLAVGDPPAR